MNTILKHSAAIPLLLLSIYLMPPAMANDEPVPDVYRPEPTALYEQSYDIAAAGRLLANWNPPKEGGLFELPIIGSLDSFGIRYASDRWEAPLFLDLGLSPTVIGGSNYGDATLGTSLNFTSHIGIGIKFGRTKQHEVKLRYQHISNGGLDEVNPGLNMIGLDFVFWGRGR